MVYGARSSSPVVLTLSTAEPFIDTFEAQNWHIFAELFRQERDLFRALANVRAHFNPIRQHLLHSGTISRPAAAAATPAAVRLPGVTVPTARLPQTTDELLGNSTLPAAMRTPLELAPTRF
jgi:hypothetical protein